MKTSLNPLSWNRAPEELIPLLQELAHHFPITEGGEGRELEFIQAGAPGDFSVKAQGKETCEIQYGSKAAAARGIGHALAGIEGRGKCPFETLGIMLDCSRHAVMTVPYVKRWLHQLALLGYNMLMLYTEDTYELPGEPLFGHMRGGYRAEEIREIDQCAAELGIEVIACIQTLGHLEQVLKWPGYQELQDTENVLLVDDDRALALIDKMVGFWAANLRSRRIHIGMDEAHGLGRGRFLDLRGEFESPFHLFNRHLDRVLTITRSHNLKAMIWSDMYFRLGNKANDYYDRDTMIPESVKKQIPDSVELVYWDYYHSDEEFYSDWIERHRALGHEPVMASGIWTWNHFWYDHHLTSKTVPPCVKASRKAGLKELVFTLWGDGGSVCEFDSAFAGLTFAADLAYGGEGDAANIRPLLAAVCGSDYEAILLGSGLVMPYRDGREGDTAMPHEAILWDELGPVDAGVAAVSRPAMLPTTVLWDDPLMGIGWLGMKAFAPDFWKQAASHYRRLRETLQPHLSGSGIPDFGYLDSLCLVLYLKIEFREKLVPAYQERDEMALRQLRDESIPEIIQAIEQLSDSFRRQWMRRNKPSGMSSTQIRLGAGITRFREAALRIGEFLDGKIEAIDELERLPEDPTPNPQSFFVWLATGSKHL
jgi:hexosaminidase